MKTYEVELKYETYAIYTVEADSPEEAEAKAWKGLESDYTHGYGEWVLESVKEMEEVK